MTASLEANVDPQCNVDVILSCLSADPETHRAECEAEWLECQGYGERAAWRLAEAAQHADMISFVLLTSLPFYYRTDEQFRARMDTASAHPVGLQEEKK